MVTLWATFCSICQFLTADPRVPEATPTGRQRRGASVLSNLYTDFSISKAPEYSMPPSHHGDYVPLGNFIINLYPTICTLGS